MSYGELNQSEKCKETQFHLLSSLNMCSIGGGGLLTVGAGLPFPGSKAETSSSGPGLMVNLLKNVLIVMNMRSLPNYLPGHTMTPVLNGINRLCVG